MTHHKITLRCAAALSAAFLFHAENAGAQDRRLDPEDLAKRIGAQRAGEEISSEKVDPRAGERASAEFRKNLETAIAYLDKNRELAAQMFSSRDLRAIAGALRENKLEAYLEEAAIRISRINARNKLYLDPIVLRVADFGRTLRAGRNLEVEREKYIRLVRQIRGPKAAQRLRSRLRAFRDLSTDFYSVIWQVIGDTPPESSGPSGPVSDTSQMNCLQEVGFSSTRNDGSMACLPPGMQRGRRHRNFSASGLIGTREIPLEPHLTCSKDQRNRGTCMSFALTANFETRGHVNRGIKFNFSEQYAYFKSEINTGNNRYSYGLPMSVFDKWARDEWATGRETTWTYNQGLSMGALDRGSAWTYRDNVYPNSCVGYSEFCTNYAFQGEPNNNHSSFSRPDPQTSVDNMKVLETDAISWGGFNQSAHNALMNVVKPSVEARVPVVVGFGVTQSYMDGGTGAGYIVWDSNDANVSGGHANLIVGYVDKDNLPAGAPEPVGDGYFILKNSWGWQRGDCGYDYIDEEWLRRKMTGLDIITVN